MRVSFATISEVATEIKHVRQQLSNILKRLFKNDHGIIVEQSQTILNQRHFEKKLYPKIISYFSCLESGCDTFRNKSRKYSSPILGRFFAQLLIFSLFLFTIKNRI